jgi:hypothetical protein
LKSVERVREGERETKSRERERERRKMINEKHYIMQDERVKYFAAVTFLRLYPVVLVVELRWK